MQPLDFFLCLNIAMSAIILAIRYPSASELAKNQGKPDTLKVKSYYSTVTIDGHEFCNVSTAGFYHSTSCDLCKKEKDQLIKVLTEKHSKENAISHSAESQQ